MPLLVDQVDGATRIWSGKSLCNNQENCEHCEEVSSANQFYEMGINRSG